MKQVIRTAFLVSIGSYALFFLADYLRPGFVSYVFSVHWLLVPTLLFGVAWAVFEDENESFRPNAILVVLLGLLGVVLAVVFWKEGDVFGDFRLIVAAMGLVTPVSIYYLLHEKGD